MLNSDHETKYSHSSQIVTNRNFRPREWQYIAFIIHCIQDLFCIQIIWKMKSRVISNGHRALKKRRNYSTELSKLIKRRSIWFESDTCTTRSHLTRFAFSHSWIHRDACERTFGRCLHLSKTFPKQYSLNVLWNRRLTHVYYASVYISSLKR